MWATRSRSAPWLALLGVFLGLHPARAVEAVLIQLSEDQATWQLPQTVPWTAQTRLTLGTHPVDLVVSSVRGRRVITRLVEPQPGLALGDHRELQTTEATIPIAPAVPPTAPATPVPAARVSAATPLPEPADTRRGTVTRIDGEHIWVTLPLAPRLDLPASVFHEDAPVATLSWLGRTAGEWKARWTGEPPHLGDRVAFTAAPASSARPAAAPSAVGTSPKPLGGEDVISGDDPLYKTLQALAARGIITHTTRRQFEGDEVVYTRRQIVDFLVPTLRQLLDPNHLWPIHTMSGAAAGQVAELVTRFRKELAERGLDMAAVDAALAARRPAETYVLPTIRADGRFQTGKQHESGVIEGTVLGSLDRRFHFGLSFGSRGEEAFPTTQRRQDLSMLFGEYDLSRHLTVGAGRRQFRFGPGLHDMLWSDQAEPLDHVYFTWTTKAFGRPFKLEQHEGIFKEGAWKFMHLRRLEWLPARQVNLAINFALLTTHTTQGLLAPILPDYLSRFVSGSHIKGGAGKFDASVELSWRFHPEWSWYGEFFTDELNLKVGGAPGGAQRVGYLTGFHYTPRRALPGTSYRLEFATLPDRGTYVYQSEPQLTWTRQGVYLGHEYGPDSSGMLFSGHQRLTPRWDVTGSVEYFRQLREGPVAMHTFRYQLASHWDLNHWFGLGVGFRHERRANVGQIRNNNQLDEGLYVEARAGY